MVKASLFRSCICFCGHIPGCTKFDLSLMLEFLLFSYVNRADVNAQEHRSSSISKSQAVPIKASEQIYASIKSYKRLIEIRNPSSVSYVLHPTAHS